VTDELDHQVRTALRRRRRSRFFPIAAIVLAICGTACAYLWVNYGAQIRTEVFATPQPTGPMAASSEQAVSRTDFDAFERQTTDSLRSAAENLEAQKTDLKTLSDQVTDLVAKVDALRNAAATAPTPPPIQNSVSGQPVVPPRPATIAQRAPRPKRPISVRGAPLPLAPPTDR
jgi:hypothetical protein